MCDGHRAFFLSRATAQHFLVGNGTNFVGADKEILECIMNWNYVAPTVFAHEGIAWKFNTPRAPHHGGSWKRLVRRVKRVLHDILGSRTVTEKVRGTKLCLVDQALNARPITPVSTDSRDLEALAPQSRFAWTLCRKLSFAICWRTLRPYADVNIVLLATRICPLTEQACEVEHPIWRVISYGLLNPTSREHITLSRSSLSLTTVKTDAHVLP